MIQLDMALETELEEDLSDAEGRSEVQQLGADQGGERVVDRRPDEDDVLLEQAPHAGLVLRIGQRALALAGHVMSDEQ